MQYMDVSGIAKSRFRIDDVTGVASGEGGVAWNPVNLLMSVILIGYRGAGKSTIGKRLADRLWWKFVDTDLLITRHTGKSIAQIFANDGEEHFRELEQHTLKDVLELRDHVIALGGGVVEREANRQVLLHCAHKRIYLHCEPDELLRRIQADPGSSSSRPALTEHVGMDEIQTKLKFRLPLYRQVKSAELDVTRLSVDEAVEYVARLM
jgi:shikimate kinase